MIPPNAARRRRGWLVALTALAAACSRDLRGESGEDLAAAAERLLAVFDAAAPTRELLQRTADAAWRLDAAALYEALPAAAGEERSVVFVATDQDGHRFVDHRTGPPPEIGAEPGDGWLLVGAQRLALPPQTYRMRIASAMSTGKADCFVVWKGLRHDLRDLERETLIGELRSAFPRTMALALRYVLLETASRPLPGRGRAVDLTLRARREALGADYPDFTAYATRLARAVRASGAVQSDAGATLISWRFREPNDELTISLRSADGLLLADRDEEPPVDLLEAQRLRFFHSTSMQAYGVTTRIEGIHGTIRTDPDSAVAEIRSEIGGEPERIAVEGAFFGVVPVVAVDLFVPGTLAGSVRGVLSTLLTGRDGKGIEIATTLRTESAERHTIASSVLADVPAGRFARLALRLAASLMQANERERTDALRLARDVVAAVRADLAGSSAAVSSARTP